MASRAPFPPEWRWISGKAVATISQPTLVASGTAGTLHMVVTVTDPRPGWRWDQGEPHVYTAVVTVESPQARRRHGQQ